MPTVNLNAGSTGKGSGTVSGAGNEHVIDFPRKTKVVSIAVQASGGNTMKVRYTFDLDASSVLWSEWSYGDANDTQVWSATFDGGFDAFEISGDGDYSYSWD
jgi:hypothetical protein